MESEGSLPHSPVPILSQLDPYPYILFPEDPS